MIVVSNLLGLLFFLWLPILISIYFFRSKPVRHKIPSLFLWQKVFLKRQNQGFLERFKNNLIFWLQLLFFALLFLALSQPYWKKGLRSKKQAYIIDNSGSMVAQSGLFNTRLSRSKELVRRHARTVENSEIEVYTWNAFLHKNLLGGNLEVKLSSIEPSHLPNGNFFNLLDSIQDLLERGYKVCLFTDSLDYVQQKRLANFGVEIFLSAQDYRNIYFDSIHENLLNDGSLKFNIGIACVSRGGGGTLVVSQEGVLLKRLPFKFASYDNYQFDFEIKPTSISEPINFEIIPDEPDSLVQDNVIKYFINSRVPRVKVSGFSESSPFLNFFRTFLVNDKRFELSKNSFQINIKRVDELPKNPENLSLYVIEQKRNEVSFEEFKSHVLVPGHFLLRFVGGNKFFSATKATAYKELNAWESLLQIEQLSTTQSTPGILLHKNLEACIVLNLEFNSESIGNPDYPILFENILRYFLQHYRTNSLVEVGSKFKHSSFPQTSSKNTQNFKDSPISKVSLQGIYRNKDGSNYYARFPVVESRLEEANRNPTAITADVSINDRGRSYGNDKNGNFPLSGLLILIALVIMLLEWYIFSKRA